MCCVSCRFNDPERQYLLVSEFYLRRQEKSELNLVRLLVFFCGQLFSDTLSTSIRRLHPRVEYLFNSLEIVFLFRNKRVEYTTPITRPFKENGREKKSYIMCRCEISATFSIRESLSLSISAPCSQSTKRRAQMDTIAKANFLQADLHACVSS
jgi:hypothetical protein